MPRAATLHVSADTDCVNVYWPGDDKPRTLFRDGYLEELMTPKLAAAARKCSMHDDCDAADRAVLEYRGQEALHCDDPECPNPTCRRC